METLFDELETPTSEELDGFDSSADQEPLVPDRWRLTEYIQSRRTKIPYWPAREGRPVDYAKWDAIQREAVDKVFALRDSGVRSVVGCGPTGFGKTRCAQLIIERLHTEGASWMFNSHRQMLLKQTHDRFEEAGIQHGVRAAQMPEWYAPSLPGQLAMIQSERAAVKQSKRRDYHAADFVIYDEHHANATGFALEMWKHYWQANAFQLGLTATPVNLGFSEELVYFGRPSQMRAIGAIVPADFQVPDEIDVKDVKKLKTGEFSSTQLAKKVMVQQVVGSIYEHLLEYNSELRPTLGFAPDVASALWLCDQGWERGIACCSIDGEKVYFGERHPDGSRVVYRGMAAREVAMGLSESGLVTCVWNRMVFAMGVDWPWLEHLIFATALGTIQFWIQACGRGLRAYSPSGKSRCMIQDHGGNWYRHLSPNEDIDWELGDTNKTVGEKKSGVQCPQCKFRMTRDEWEANGRKCKKCGAGGENAEAVLCPECKKPMKGELWKKNNGKCIHCGFTFGQSERRVWQTSGRLKTVKGSATTAKKNVLAEPQKLWNALYYPSANSNSSRANTFAQLKGRFNSEYGDRYLIIPGKWKHEGSMIFFDKETKECRRAGMMPRPGSTHWQSVAKAVDRSELQHSEKT